MKNWFEVDTTNNNEIVTYKKWWKLQLLKWIVLPPMVIIFWVIIIPLGLTKTFLKGGWNDLNWELRNFDEHKLMIELFQWYKSPTKRVK